MALLEVKDIKKEYVDPDGKSQPVIDIPTFEMEERQELALAGRSGCGKTTFLNMIAGILRPDSGSIRFGGRDYASLSESQLDHLRAGHIGYVFQTFNLLGGYSALENVLLGMMFGPGPDRGFAQSLLEELGLGSRLAHRPHQLSVGQQQRVALARALANRPELVLADEPTGSLDPEHAREALELMRSACSEHGTALLVVSHDEEVLGAFETRMALHEINHVTRGARGGTL